MIFYWKGSANLARPEVIFKRAHHRARRLLFKFSAMNCCVIWMFVACTASRLTERAYVGRMGRFTVPLGWNVSWPPESKGPVLKPAGDKAPLSVEIWEHYCSLESTEGEMARGYLNYIRDSQYLNGRLEIVGSVVHSKYGRHNIYRILTGTRTGPNERYLVFMASRGKCVEMSLFSSEPQRAHMFLPDFYNTARSFYFRE